MADQIPDSFRVELAESPEDRERIYAFRYAIYVEEQGKARLSCADHDRKRLTDDLDPHALLFFVERAGRVVATLRVNRGADHPFPEPYRSIYQLERFSTFPDSAFSMTSRTMVAKELRGSPIIGLLVCRAYATVLQSGVRFDFSHCTPGLVGPYEHLGCRRYIENFRDPEVGYRVPLVMVVRDAEHLQRVRSPLCAVVRAFATMFSEAPECAWFASTFPASAEVAEWMLSDEEYWGFLAGKLAVGAQCPLLDGLTDAESLALLKRGTVLTCRRGDGMIHDGDVGTEMFLVLSGTFEVRRPGATSALAVFGAGDTIGELAMLLGCARSANVVAVEDSEVLVMNASFVQKLMTSAPALAAKVLFNLSRIIGERLICTTRRRTEGEASR